MSEPSLVDYLLLLRRRWLTFTVIFGAVLVLAFLYGLSRHTATSYQSSAMVEVGWIQPYSNQTAVSTRQFLETPEQVVYKINNNLYPSQDSGLSGSLFAAIVPDTNIITISATNGSKSGAELLRDNAVSSLMNGQQKQLQDFQKLNVNFATQSPAVLSKKTEVSEASISWKLLVIVSLPLAIFLGFLGIVAAEWWQANRKYLSRKNSR